ncbi:MAG: toxin-antitoxin system HicB family antitoxin [Myxococcota bacterium]
MSTLSLRLPQSVHRQLSALAKREGVSINQLINSAVAAALMTAEYLEERARRSLMLFSRMLPTSSLMTSIG